MDLDPRSVAPEELYKLQIQIITPRPIAWVSTVAPNGVLNLAPFSFSSGVGTHPPTHLFCPTNRRDGMKKDTLRNVEATGEYVVGVVPYAVREAMNATSADFPAAVDEFAKAGLTPVKSRCVAPPRIKESPINMECKVLTILHLGEGPHGSNVVVGEIVHIHIDDAVLRNGAIDPALVDTIGRMDGRGYCRTTDRFEMPRPRI